MYWFLYDSNLCHERVYEPSYNLRKNKSFIWDALKKIFNRKFLLDIFQRKGKASPLLFIISMKSCEKTKKLKILLNYWVY